MFRRKRIWEEKGSALTFDTLAKQIRDVRPSSVQFT